MEYAYATLILNEADREINERNLTKVLEAAGVDVIESRTKAFVAAMEGVDLDETVDTPDTDSVLADVSTSGESTTAGATTRSQADADVPDEDSLSSDDADDDGDHGSSDGTEPLEMDPAGESFTEFVQGDESEGS